MKNLIYVTVLLCLFFFPYKVSALLFSNPVPVGIDTTRPIRGPYLSPDQLSLYFNYEDGGPNQFDLFCATRPDTSSSFGTPFLAMGATGVMLENHPYLSDDALSVYYSAGTDGPLTMDIWKATRLDINSQFSNPIPIDELNSDYQEWGPTITSDGLTIFFGSSRPGAAGMTDIYTATRPDINSAFSIPVNVTELNTAYAENNPAISGNGSMIFFNSNRDTSYTTIWVAIRPNNESPFGTPIRLDELNPDGIDTAGPHFSRDGKTLYFQSVRDDSLGGCLWMATLIPEPSTISLIMIGLPIGLRLFVRRKR